jgi:hypothetical protein
MSKNNVTQIKIDQKARPPHPVPENRANQERGGAPDEVNGSGTDTSYFFESYFSVDTESDRRNCLDTRCASRSKATLVAKSISGPVKFRRADFLLTMM